MFKDRGDYRGGFEPGQDALVAIGTVDSTAPVRGAVYLPDIPGLQVLYRVYVLACLKMA